MNNYGYNGYRRPEEVDLSVYSFPNSPGLSPASREQHFLQELRNLRADIDNSSQFHNYREVPIALSPSFQAPLPSQIPSLHRTFSDSSVIINPPWERTLRSSNGRINPGWMDNPPPPFANFSPPEGYSSLERGVNSSATAKTPAGRGFFKCASPTPWLSSDNLAREEEIPQGGTRQRFFSPGPRQETSSHSVGELDRTWDDSSSRQFEKQRQAPMTQQPMPSRWDKMHNVQQEPSRSYEQGYSRWDGSNLPARDTSLSRQPPWEQEVPRERVSRRAEWENRQQPPQPQQNNENVPRIERNWNDYSQQQPNWELNQERSPWLRQGTAQRQQEPSRQPEWREDDLQQRQQVQKDLLQEIQKHRQQTSRTRAPPIDSYREPYKKEANFNGNSIQQQPRDHSLTRNYDTESNWRHQNTPLAPLLENRSTRRTDWPDRKEQLRGDNNDGIWRGGPIYNNVPAANLRNYSDTADRHPQDRRSYVEDPMSRSQEHARRGGFFSQAAVPNRAMTEPPGSMGVLDRAMQNRTANNNVSHSIGPELEMDVTVTHFQNADGRTVASRNHSPQRHSYAGTFSEFSRPENDPPAYTQYPGPPEPRPRTFTYDGISSIMSSPTVTPPLPADRSLPNSPIQRSASLLFRREQDQGPKWELDSLYGMAPPGSRQHLEAQRSFTRNQETAQRSTLTAPMYGRGTLNERQPERTSVEKTTAVVNPMPPIIMEPPPKAAPQPKHTGILLNPNETRKTSKRRVMFREEGDDCYGKEMFGGSDGDAPAHVKAYDGALEDPLSRFMSLSNQIGGDIAEAAKKFNNAMDLQRHFLWQAASQAKPTADGFQKLFKPLIDAVQDIISFKDSKRQSPHFNHLNVIAEGIPALGWVQVEKTPAPHVKEMAEAAMFYVNRILKDYKEKDPKHVEWVKSFQDIMKELQTFVRQTHTTGLVWNSAPGNAPAGAPKASASAPGPSGGAPPPPPPPPAGLFADIPKASAQAADDGRSALFAQLNQGSDITKGLKKVTSEMQTHKNPNLRTTSTVPSASSHSSESTSSLKSSPAKAVQKQPKTELENGKQWTVEFYNGNKNIVVEITDKKQSVYVDKCTNSTVQIKGKCNSIVLDGCKKTAVVVDGVVAQIETINCQSVQIQTMGDLPTLSIQKTDGCQVYLSEASKNCEIVTSKSSEMNVLVPEGPDGEFIELPLPEQFKTIYKGGKLVTTVSDIC